MIIKYFAWLKNITLVEEEILTDLNVTDTDSLKKYLIKKYPKLKTHMDQNLIRIAINLNYSFNNEKIKSEDEIALFPPVSGG